MIVTGLDENGNVVAVIHMDEAKSFVEVTGDQAVALGQKLDGTELKPGMGKEMEEYLSIKTSLLGRIRRARTISELKSVINEEAKKP